MQLIDVKSVLNESGGESVKTRGRDEGEGSEVRSTLPRRDEKGLMEREMGWKRGCDDLRTRVIVE